MPNPNLAAEAAICSVGAITPVGCSRGEILESLKAGRDGIAIASKIDTSHFASNLCAEHAPFDFSSVLSSEELAQIDDAYLRLALACARLAVASAGLQNEKFGLDTALIVATCNAGMNSREAEYLKRLKLKDGEFTLAESLQSEFHTVSKVLRKGLGIRGASYVINTACSGSTAALGLAASLVESGRYKRVIVGGADAVALANYAGFNAIKVVSPHKIAPFSEPVGMNIGEGAAFWVVENCDFAKSRNAEILGKIIGHSTGADAHHPTQPDPRGDGVFRTLRDALADARVEARSVGCISAHASGTLANDKAESAGIKKFCASVGTDIVSTSLKSYVGHCMGATGIIEATCQLFAMLDGFVPPTLHFTTPRASCDIYVAHGDLLYKDYGCFIKSNYAFAGNNAAIVVSKPNFPAAKPAPDRAMRIAVTGMGLVSPLGMNLPDTLSALKAGRSGIAKIDRFKVENPNYFIAGLAEKINTRKLDRRIDFSGMNFISICATLAAKEALDCAGIRVDRRISERVGLTAGVYRGASEEAHMRAVFESADRRGDVACFSNITANSTAGWVSKALEIKGANITLTSGRDCGLQAIAHSCDVLRCGRADYCVALSADELYSQMLSGYARAGLMYENSAAENFGVRFDIPFRSVYGEGSAAFALESYSSARARGAKIYCEILGFGQVCDNPDLCEDCRFGDGLALSAHGALEDAGLSAADIDAVAVSASGNAADAKIANLIKDMFPQARVLTASFNTGNMPACGAAANLACSVKCAADGDGFWNSRADISAFGGLQDGFSQCPVRKIICLSCGDIGNNYAMVVGV